jgi:hypothetical protein
MIVPKKNKLSDGRKKNREAGKLEGNINELFNFLENEFKFMRLIIFTSSFLCDFNELNQICWDLMKTF